ncbi:hypothetical protein GCM10007881_66140 [Mesorhizobium huakuii]|nr:hypothetical protein GCM10007881_66140 [Mesorhizobium huakuii]
MMLVKGDQPVLAHLLQDAVEVNATHSRGVSQDLMGQWQIEGMIPHKIDASKAGMQLAKEMSKMRRFLVPPHICQPNPQGCLFDQGDTYESSREVGMASHRRGHGLPIQNRNHGRGECGHASDRTLPQCR